MSGLDEITISPRARLNTQTVTPTPLPITTRTVRGPRLGGPMRSLRLSFTVLLLLAIVANIPVAHGQATVGVQTFGAYDGFPDTVDIWKYRAIEKLAGGTVQRSIYGSQTTLHGLRFRFTICAIIYFLIGFRYRNGFVILRDQCMHGMYDEKRKSRRKQLEF